MRFFKDIKKNEIKESKQEIQKNITSKDLQEQQRKLLNRYRRHLKEYDEEQTQEKYKELIDVHTELKAIEKQIEELKLIPNQLTDADFNIPSEDINPQTKEAEIISDIKQEEMITGDDGIIRPKSMHDQIESNKCLFCEEKFGFTKDWNIHMMEKHPEELIEYNKKEIEKLASTNENVAKIVDIVNIAEVIFEENEKLEKEEPIIHENLSNTEIPKETLERAKIDFGDPSHVDPDLQVINDEMKSRKIESKEEYDVMMDEAEKDSPYVIQQQSDIKPLNNEPQIIPDQIKEIAEKLEILKKPVIPTEAIVDLKEIIPSKKPKIKFDLSKIFQKKKFSKLKGIEAYCNICKHTVQQHEYQGKSEGCVKCGCLKTVQEILEINEVDLKYGEEKPILDNGIYCICGHSQLTHKENAKFCEVEDCHCVRFRTK